MADANSPHVDLKKRAELCLVERRRFDHQRLDVDDELNVPRLVQKRGAGTVPPTLPLSAASVIPSSRSDSETPRDAVSGGGAACQGRASGAEGHEVEPGSPAPHPGRITSA